MAKKTAEASTKSPGKRRASTKSNGDVAPSQPAAESAADAVDAQLAKYRSMRHFDVTAEPSGGARDGTAMALTFCIQKHAATRLHYDFRLGWNGVLKSWAVAKGPSYNVKDKRLAVEVEDHPMEYGGFEGIIPAGQYGGGTVMLWDQGTWAPQPGYEDVDAGLRDGHLKFLMYGAKIKGKWALIRMGGKAATERKPNWLLIKEHDEFERGPDDLGIADAEPNSVVTGRTMEQIAHNEDHVWNSKETAGTGQAWYRRVGRPDTTEAVPASKSWRSPVRAFRGPAQSPANSPAGQPRENGASPQTSVPSNRPAIEADLLRQLQPQLNALRQEPQPDFLKPQLAIETALPPEGRDWIHELKLDGYRIQGRKTGATVQMLTRSGLDWTYRVPAMAQAVARLPIDAITLDGEVVVLGPDGTTNFADLQASFQEGAHNPLTYFCFDLLHIAGCNPRELPLRARKDLLAHVLAAGDGDEVRLSEHLEVGGEQMFRRACELHAEGIVSKRADAPYSGSRNGAWLKSKCLHEQEFVVGGYTLSSDGPDRIGSLLLGYYRDGKLVYAGRTGTGFTQKSRRALKDQLTRLETPKAAFATVPTDAKRGAVWVRPEFVAQVRFATWTADDLVRQAAFLGLREDKVPAEVRREGTGPQPKNSAPKGPDQTSASHTRAPKVAKPITLQPAPPTEKAPVRLTHSNKILDAESGVTKQMLADFYWAVADRMLPYIADRPLSLVRCPEGSGKPCFFQKHVNHMLPPGVGSVDVPDKKTGVLEPYITLSTREALAGLAQMGVLEVHPWGSRNDDLERADRLIFDLDPDEALGWEQVTAAAADVRTRLRGMDLESFLKTTGGKGLHVVVPIEPEAEWPAIKDWAHAFVRGMERAQPALYLTKMTKAARVGKIYLDYLRNERGATAVAPYSPRARPGMGVSMPLGWNELSLPERPSFRIANYPEWGGRLNSDPWKGITKIKQKLPLKAVAV